MPGPCSLPTGPRAAWEKHNNIVCNLHHRFGLNAVNCTPDEPVTNKGKEIAHEWVTTRVYLFNRNKLKTGKS